MSSSVARAPSISESLPAPLGPTTKKNVPLAFMANTLDVEVVWQC
ncbi:protein of unknown function [Cupriavidus taiwanensis]|nr:protein of unknown function [Cupriavidus taiwanensis]